ncbi:MAG: UDP-N-acetylmuramate:L-alanyl-gamma-D-glutamyl-meso-diaminopimelate ligase, partial [Gammaproteobacteria bacterium]
MHIHILGVCGTFMAGLALIARELGHQVSGCDANVYPPMSDQLQQAGIELIEGWDPDQLSCAPDLCVIGNAMSRGNPLVEAILDQRLAYTSGPQWLSESVLRSRRVLAVAGTHGKTTTSSMLAWILETTGHQPGFLIGGIPGNFGLSARLGESDLFVIEADEYDTAFFDKRSKFVHYLPSTLVLNNLEFDHADIFPDLAAIQQQFHHLLRTVPANGTLVVNGEDERLEEVLDMGCWSQLQKFGPKQQWQAEATHRDCSEFRVIHDGEQVASVSGTLFGEHNMSNALAAIAAAATVGIKPAEAAAALANFKNAQRRLEERYRDSDTVIYDDFAHHPTAIRLTVGALRARVQNQRILAVVDLSSNTMRMGIHEKTLAGALAGADEVVLHAGDRIRWDPQTVIAGLAVPAALTKNVDDTLRQITARLRSGDQVLIMSNGG